MSSFLHVPQNMANAQTEYSKLRDVQNMKQMISRKSKIQDFLGDKETRNDAVKRYRELEKGV